jgi:hypothetical protein
MTVKEIIFALWRKLSNGDIPDDSPYTYNELRIYVRSGLRTLMEDSYYKDINNDDTRYGADNISVTTTNTINTDATTGLKYITTTNSTVSVGGNRQVSITSANPVSRYAVNYIPIRQEEVLVNRLQDQIPCVVLYYREGDRFYFFNGETKDKTVKLTERYAIPSDDEAEIEGGTGIASRVIAAALQILMSVQVPADKNNDGTNNT